LEFSNRFCVFGGFRLAVAEVDSGLGFDPEDGAFEETASRLEPPSVLAFDEGFGLVADVDFAVTVVAALIRCLEAAERLDPVI